MNVANEAPFPILEGIAISMVIIVAIQLWKRVGGSLPNF